MKAKRKTLPLDNVLNRLNALAVSYRQSGRNCWKDRHNFSSKEAAASAEHDNYVMARALELFALDVIGWRQGETNSIFNYHQSPCEHELEHLSELFVEYENR